MEIAGIHCPLTLKDIDLSREINNRAPLETSRPNPNTAELKGLAEIIQKYNVPGFGIHVVHAHQAVSEGEAMVTAKARPTDGLVVPILEKRPKSANDLLSGEYHPRVITATDDTRGGGKGPILHPSEYQTGMLPENISTVNQQFYAEALVYMYEHPLIALILLDTTYTEEILELDDSKGATWKVNNQGGYLTLKGHEHHSYTKDGKHIVYTDGKIAYGKDTV